MLELLTAPQNTAFAVALAVMLGIAVIEAVSALFGATLSSLLDNLLPDIELDVDADLSGADAPTAAPLTQLLSWLHVGRVPALMLLVIFLTGFGLSGLAIQSLSERLVGTLLPGWIATGPAMLAAVYGVRLLGGVLGRFMLRDETDALPASSLVGQVAVITLGEARVGSAAEARITDTRGTTHYVMVEPDNAGETFSQGSEVLLTSREGATFKATANPRRALPARD